MKSRAKSRNRSNAVYALMLVAAMGLGAAGVYVKYSGPAQSLPDELKRHNTVQNTQGTKPSQVEEPTEQVTVMRVVPNETGITLERTPITVPAGVNPIAHSITETLRAFKQNQVRALDVEVKNGTATIFFNPAVKDMALGSMEESMLIKAIRTAVGQFPEVKGIELSLEGQPITSFGHSELEFPLAPLH